MDLDSLSPSVAAFVTRIGTMTDDDRLAVAQARRAVDEPFHERALAAAAEALVGRSEEYVRARRLVAHAHIPDRLEALDSSASEDEELDRWTDVARLVQLAIDDALIAVLGSDVLHPKHLRELLRSVNAVHR